MEYLSLQLNKGITMKKIALVLSGCGHKDGSEVTEAVSTMISITKMSAQYHCFAPDKDIMSSNHYNDESTGVRNILSESARLCRGKIDDLKSLNANDYDAIIFPGGFGVALHLCNWATAGAQCEVLPDVVRVVREFNEQGKPIGAICIAPALIGKVLGDKEVILTLGNDIEAANELEKTGSVHENCAVDDFVTDRTNKVVSTPAYMYEQASATQVYHGIEGMVKEVVEMA